MSSDDRRALWRRRAERVRPVPLEALAERLGYRPDPRHRGRWRRPDSILAIDGSRFYDHHREHGGGGAIDLVRHVRGCDFREAVEFLEGAPPRTLPRTPEPFPEPPPLRLPQPDFSCWEPVRDYLVQTRRIDPVLVEEGRRSRSIYADCRRNAVFPCRDLKGRIRGAEIAGTRPRPDGSTFKALAPGSRRDRGGFRILPSDPDAPSAILLVESAVDALSAASLLAGVMSPGLLIVSAAGTARKLPRWLPREPSVPVLCGYDDDPAGDRAAQRLISSLPLAMRIKPGAANDWNDLLRSVGASR